MGALLGLPGQMIEFAQWREEQSVTHGRALNVTETIGGGSFAFRAPRVRRTWQLKGTGLRPEQVTGFEMLAYGAFGSGPFWLIDPEARVTNALTPAQSLVGLGGNLAGVTGDAVAGAAVTLSNGVTVPSLSSGGKNVYARMDVPVLAGAPITVSMYVAGPANVRVSFIDVAGKFLSQGTLVRESGPGFVRAVGTQTPPPGAAMAYFTITGATGIAAPAVTFTPSPMPWAVGKGCSSATLAAWDKSYEHASPDARGRREVSVSVTVEEVGEGA